MEHFATLHSKVINDVERYSLQLQTCKSISSPPWGETINWPQLVLIVAPVSIEKTQDGALSSMTHSSHGLFFCVELHFGLLSVVEKLMFLQDCWFGETFVTISSMSVLVRPLPA